MRKIKGSDCDGCRNNFYNGNNELGVKKCWSFGTAEMVKKVQIHVDQMPPYRNVKPTLRPSCYHVARFVFVKPEAIGKDGYWAR